MFERRHLAVGLALLALCLACCTGQSSDDLCAQTNAQSSCDNCIQTHPDCFWCTDPPVENSTMAVIHCYNISNTDVSVCENTVENPISTVQNEKALPLSTESVQGQESIQVSPQIVRMNLRQNDPQSFRMSFIALRNTPLDVYFLLDVSASLVATISSLSNNLDAIADSIQNVSSNFRIGIGGFVDKNVFPYAGLDDYRILFAGTTLICRQDRGVCDPAYGFRHWQSLTNNVSEFREALSSSSQQRINVDRPEGSLDALMQVAVCTDIIGWNAAALKMVFLITDNHFHIAGDGYLAGLVRPNDGLCHLELFNGSTTEYEYTFSNVQDYPSIHQVLAALEDQLVVPIFSIQQNVDNDPNIEPYQTLADEMERIQAQAVPIQRTAGLVTAQTIIDLINEAYENTSQTVQVNQVNVPGYRVTVRQQNCPDDQRIGMEGCRVSFNEIIDFDVTVELVNCEMAAVNNTIQLRGPPYMFSDIIVTPQCDCGCSADENTVPDIPLCNGGTLRCGRCDCMEGRDGTFCECESGNFQQVCLLFEGQQCGGENRGRCSSCGECECISPNFGPACQCDNNTCPTNCNGRGECQCPGGCECTARAPLSNELFLGDQCECNPDELCWSTNFIGTDQQLCHSPSPNASSGMCSCGGCDCSEEITGQSGLGDFGGLCLPTEQCPPFFSTCVSCFLRNTGTNIVRDCSVSCSNAQGYRLLASGEEPTDEYARVACVVEFRGCNYDFYLGRPDSYSVPVLVDPNPDCPSLLPFWAPYVIAAAIVLAIIIIGLLILCLLKICFVLWDKREYKKFAKELQDADFAPHENPLYLTPQQDYQNPLRRQRSSQRK